MKKVIVVLAAIVVLFGSVGMTASAVTTAVCSHTSIISKKGQERIETYTHPWQVGKTENGKPILAACLVEIKWQEYKYVCQYCGKELGSYEEKIYENHSMH